MRSLLEGSGSLSVRLKGSLSLSKCSLVGSSCLLFNKLSTWVELEESIVVGQGILLSVVSGGFTGFIDDGLDFIGVDNSCNVSVSKN